MSQLKNVDDLIVQDMTRQPFNPIPAVQNTVSTPPPQQPVENSQPVEQHQTEQQAPVEQEQQNALQETLEQKPVEQPQSSETSQIDEYGNPLAKERTYTNSEVQQMIRERLARAKLPEQTPHQQRNEEQFQHNPESNESWEAQLEEFVERTIDKRQKKIAEKQWQEQELTKQQQFEAKFSSEMAKYSDFHQVVAGKPITDGIMLSTRTLENPAAFIYGAAKMHPQELAKIANIADPVLQAVEVGRLHERMVKERRTISNSPQPLQQPPAGMPPAKISNQPSLEDRINEYAKQKRK